MMGANGKPLIKSSSRHVGCRGCVPGGFLLNYSAGITPVHLHPPMPEAVANFTDAMFEARALGHGIGRASSDSRIQIQGLLADPRVKYLTAEPVLFRGEDALLVEGEYVAGTSVHRCWLVPAKGYSVIRFEWSERPAATGGPRKMYVEIDNELRQDAPSGIWFPRRSHARRYTTDGILAGDYLTDVEVAEFNRSPDPSVFTLAGLKLSPGVPVFDNAVGTSQFWDGTKLAKSYKGPLPPEYKDIAKPLVASPSQAVNKTPDPTRMPRWVYLVAGGLAMVGCALLALARRARS